MPALKNHKIVLASRPVGEPKPTDFRLVEEPLGEPGPGQILLKTLWLSLDPYMRGRMSAAKSYADPLEIGQVMTGGAVSKVSASNNPAFSVGDIVVGNTGWQEHARRRRRGAAQGRPDARARSRPPLGVLGMPGMTAYTGLLNIGQPKPGETLVVAAASGAVGAIVGQIAKLKGCRVVGIAGGPDKVRYLTEELGFDVGLDHRAPDFAERLQRRRAERHRHLFRECRRARVGRGVSAAEQVRAHAGLRPDRALQRRRAAAGARPPAAPHARDPQQPAHLPRLHRPRLRRSAAATSCATSAAGCKAGKIKYREDVVHGLEKAPEALIGLLQGRNFGKLLVKVAEAG